MAKDPVCGMEINDPKTATQVSYKGQTYYFCTEGCKNRFEKEPDKYVKTHQ